jgi:DNA modification methylase
MNFPIEIGKSKINNNDCLSLLKKIENNSIDLIFTKIPFPEDLEKETEYIYNCIKEMDFKIKKEKGSVIVLFFREKYNKGFASMYAEKIILKIIENTNLNVVDKIQWIKTNFFKNQKSRHGLNSYETVYVLNNNKEKININKDYIRIPYKEVYKNITSFHCFPNSYDHCGVDAINCLFFNENKNTGYSEEIANYFIGAYSKEEDVVLDPFGDNYTNSIVSFSKKRNFIYSNPEKSKCLELYDLIVNQTQEKRIEDDYNFYSLEKGSKREMIFNKIPNKQKRIF